MSASDSPVDFSAWIGRTEQAQDHLSHNLIKRIAATFGEPTPADGDALPPLWQWCFFQEPVFEAQLGGDGHPARGGFLPPADNRNRMWAGGRVEFIQPLIVGADAHRLSTILHIEEKHGRTGSLLFVTVRHDYSQHGELCVREEQDIVYREPNPPKLTSGEPPAQGDWSETVEPTPTLLFRYSRRDLQRSSHPLRLPLRDRDRRLPGAGGAWSDDRHVQPACLYPWQPGQARASFRLSRRPAAERP